MVSISYIIRNTDLRAIKSKNDARRFLTENMCPNQEYTVKVSDTFVFSIKTDASCNVAIFSKRGNLKDIFNPIVEETRVLTEAVDWVYKYRKYISAKFLARDEG